MDRDGGDEDFSVLDWTSGDKEQTVLDGTSRGRRGLWVGIG